MMTDAQAAVAPFRRASGGAGQGWAATLILVIGSQLFAPTLRPIVLSLLCGGLTSIVAKQFTGYGRVWTYLLIAEVWCVAAFCVPVLVVTFIVVLWPKVGLWPKRLRATASRSKLPKMVSSGYGRRYSGRTLRAGRWPRSLGRQR